jgi:hypothetical protein
VTFDDQLELTMTSVALENLAKMTDL